MPIRAIPRLGRKRLNWSLKCIPTKGAEFGWGTTKDSASYGDIFRWQESATKGDPEVTFSRGTNFVTVGASFTLAGRPAEIGYSPAQSNQVRIKTQTGGAYHKNGTITEDS